VIVIPVVPLALVAAVLAPNRGPSTEPLIHAKGWNRTVTTSGYVGGWHDNDEMSTTLGTGDYIEVRWGGICWTDGGPVVHSRLLRHGVCVR
jgi:hypothetical protein